MSARDRRCAVVLALGAIIGAAPAAAQATVAGRGDLLHAPNGRVVATIRDGARVTTGPATGGFTETTVEGWIATRLLGAPRDSFPATVRGTGVNLRVAPATGAAVVAEPQNGMGAGIVRRDGEWTLIRRTGWVRTRALRGGPAAAGATTSAAPPAGQRPSPGMPGAAGIVPIIPESSAYIATREATLREGPDGPVRATLTRGARMEALARERDWIRVRIEGWVHHDALVAGDTSLRAPLVPADLRSDPGGTRGQIVRWEMQVLAFQTADPLQKDLARDEPYLLARGPGSDPSLVYLAIPPSLVDRVQRMPPLAPITVTARVRSGRSTPGGVPILDVMSIIGR